MDHQWTCPGIPSASGVVKLVLVPCGLKVEVFKPQSCHISTETNRQSPFVQLIIKHTLRLTICQRQSFFLHTQNSLSGFCNHMYERLIISRMMHHIEVTLQKCTRQVDQKKRQPTTKHAGIHHILSLQTLMKFVVVNGN